MLSIPQDVYDAIVAHAYAEHPVEACGIVAGQADGAPVRHVPMVNAEQSTTFFRFDPDQQLAVWHGMDARGEEPLIVYHSHTATDAWPSRTDIEFATEPDAHYIIVSTRDMDGPGDFQFHSFRITDGVATEEPVTIAAAV